MIKVNLKATGKSTASGGNEFVANVDFSGLNLKMIIICVVLGYGPGFLYFNDIWVEERSVFETQLKQLNTVAAKLKEEQKSMADYSRQLEDLKSKEASIKKRLNVVNSVIERRNNPMKIMLYISENIPEDIWLREITVEGMKFSLKGNAISFKSIGKLRESLEQSIFFGQRVTLDDYKSKDIKGSRVQEFTLSASIVKFE